MREIKFRAKRKLNGDWITGSFIKGSGEDWDFIHPIPHDEEYNPIRVISSTLGQFIGHKDKNGKEIYEGDITSDEGGSSGVVEWDEDLCQFLVIYSDNYEDQIAGNWCIVIGNIHENKNLL